MAHSTIDAVRQIMAATELTYSEAAILAGVSPSTLRMSLVTGEMPERSNSRLQIAKFVERNRGAASRLDLRFV